MNVGANVTSVGVAGGSLEPGGNSWQTCSARRSSSMNTPSRPPLSVRFWQAKLDHGIAVGER